jgi:3-hydroxybutyryl-CoA dehydrogenase
MNEARSPITRAIVVGSGAMGSGIAQVFAEAGLTVHLIDVNAEALARGVATLEKNLERRVTKGTFSPEQIGEIRSRVYASSDITSEATNAEIALEAVFENLEVKSAIIGDLDRALSSDAIIASNTSSISISRLAAISSHPQRVVGMHFFNPAPIMPLVEVVRGLQTSDETVSTVSSLATTCGKTPIESTDSPGFVGNRILLPMINEAMFALGEGVASRDGIDQVMKLGMNHPMGPLALADLIGLDVCLDILTVLQRDFGDDKYRPAPLLRRMVAAGQLGRKSGRGFYHYAAGETPE